MADFIVNLLWLAFLVTVIATALYGSLQGSLDPEEEADIARRGAEVEAEILGHFEAGIPLGKGIRPTPASWDPLELELRYVFNGREIVSRRRVPLAMFFRTRGMKTLKIKVSPDQPKQWVALV